MRIPSVKAAAALMLSGWALVSGFSLLSMDHRVNSLSLGEMVHSPGVRYAGMGGAGAALSDSVNWNALNPASYARMDFTSLSVCYLPEITYLKEKDNSETFLAFTNDFPLTEMVIPLGRYGTAFAGYRRGRLLDYDIQFTDAQGFLVHRTGQGGTYTLRAGYAYEIKKTLSLGASLGEMYGNTRLGQFIDPLTVPEGASRLTPSYFQKVQLSGYMAEFGVLARLGRVGVSVSGSLPVNSVRAERESQVIQNYTAADSIVTKRQDNPDMDAQVPITGNVGLAWSPRSRLNFALDATGVLWDNTQGRSTEYRVGTGAEWFFSDKRSEHYYLNIPVRLGYFYHEFGYAEGIREQGATLGWTLPTAGFYGYLNFALEGGRRYQGSILDSPFSETYTRLSVQFVHKGRWGRLRRAAESEF